MQIDTDTITLCTGYPANFRCITTACRVNLALVMQRDTLPTDNPVGWKSGFWGKFGPWV